MEGVGVGEGEGVGVSVGVGVGGYNREAYGPHSLAHHEEREIAIAEQAEDDERQGEEAEPQHDVHVLFSHGTHDPGNRGEKGSQR